jgi:hypothetical protein
MQSCPGIIAFHSPKYDFPVAVLQQQPPNLNKNDDLKQGNVEQIIELGVAGISRYQLVINPIATTMKKVL